MRAIPESMDPAVVGEIDARLDAIESSEHVAIPWAIESGSRAWGFPSPDSDYDGRFFFVRRRDDYLSPWPKRDVIETPLDKIFDVNGWDLAKTLTLLVKGNGTVTEWLRSPIVYRGDVVFRDELLALAESVLDRALLGRHYLHVGRRQWEAASSASLKRVFYALRPAAVLRWLDRNPSKKVPPMNLREVLAGCDAPPDLTRETDDLIALKSVTRELGNKVETDAGIHGWGEGGISGKEQGMAAIVDAFTPQLLGEDPRRIDHLWQIMFRGGFFESGTVMSGAISAVDIALWDIFGKSVNLPCWMLLGGRSRDRIECYKATNLKEIPGFLAAGWHALRLGPGECTDPQIVDPDACVRSSIEMFREARRIAGEEPKICMDFHTRFNAPAAVQICEGVKDYRPFFIEDPLRSPSPKSYVAFRQRTSVPLAVGEECSSKWEFQQLIESDAIDYARIDLCNVGGLTEAKKVAAMAETHFIDVIPHNPLGPLSTAACIQLSVAIPNLMLLEYGPGPDHAPDLFTNHFKFKAPYYEIPTAPGLGVDVNEGNLAKYPWKAWQCPRMYRPDGAFNNW